jgi:hypothetical protein
MLKNTLFALACVAGLIGVVPAPLNAQSDLDTFMERVLARRDDNWKKLQQYVLDEKESFDLSGPGGIPLFGFRRDYTWFIRQGVFVRSPVRANGVAVSEADRKKEEDEYLRREQRREERRKKREENAKNGTPNDKENKAVVISPTGVKVIEGDTKKDDQASGAAPPSNVEDLLRQGAEPQFVSMAYFLKFKFETGHYALVGREKIDNQDTLKIEYYPKKLFNDENARKREAEKKPGNQKKVDEDELIEEKMNKVSMVTIWVDPKTYQILQYTFDDIEMDFLPGRSIARVDDLKATMRMAQAFPNIWLPNNIEMKFQMTFAIGTVDARYRVDYHDYKEAAVTYKIKP